MHALMPQTINHIVQGHTPQQDAPSLATTLIETTNAPKNKARLGSRFVHLSFGDSLLIPLARAVRQFCPRGVAADMLCNHIDQWDPSHDATLQCSTGLLSLPPHDSLLPQSPLSAGTIT